MKLNMLLIKYKYEDFKEIIKKGTNMSCPFHDQIDLLALRNSMLIEYQYEVFGGGVGVKKGSISNMNLPFL